MSIPSIFSNLQQILQEATITHTAAIFGTLREKECRRTELTQVIVHSGDYDDDCQSSWQHIPRYQPVATEFERLRCTLEDAAYEGGKSKHLYSDDESD